MVIGRVGVRGLYVQNIVHEILSELIFLNDKKILKFGKLSEFNHKNGSFESSCNKQTVTFTRNLAVCTRTRKVS